MTKSMFMSRHGLAACFLATLALASCASPNAKIYTLIALGGDIRSAGRPVTLSVATVGVPKYLDRPQIVRRSGEVELGVAEFERWGEPLGNMVQRVLAEDLTRRLPRGSVVTTSRTLTGDETSSIELDLSRFDAQADGTIVLDAQWRIRRNGRGVSPPQTVRITRRPADAGTPATVKAMSDAIGDLAARIAARMG
jgi:uncharacterized lipoprotein YmbA